MLNDRCEEQKIIEVVQALILMLKGIVSKRADYLISWIIYESSRSLGGTVCCSILSFRAQSMSPTFRQQMPVLADAAYHDVILLVAA